MYKYLSIEIFQQQQWFTQLITSPYQMSNMLFISKQEAYRTYKDVRKMVTWINFARLWFYLFPNIMLNIYQLISVVVEQPESHL